MVAAAVMGALLPGSPLEGKNAEVRTDPNLLCSFHFQDADLGHVLFFFGRRFRLNMVIPPDLTGRVTLRLTDVTWKQALELICRQHGLVIQWIGGGDRDHTVKLMIQKTEK